jgi:hypothetical protein
MKSSSIADELFEAYENMRTLSEIESAIAVITPTAIRTSSQYFKGYLDALGWVIGEERKGGDDV